MLAGGGDVTTEGAAGGEGVTTGSAGGEDVTTEGAAGGEDVTTEGAAAGDGVGEATTSTLLSNSVMQNVKKLKLLAINLIF